MIPQFWIVNGEPIELPPLATRDPAYPAPSDPAYPAPERVNAAHVTANCESSPYPCLRLTMPSSCQLEVGATFSTCASRSSGQNVPTSEEVIAEPTSPSPLGQSVAQSTDPQSIPEPITVVLFGMGAAGLAGYTRSRRRTD